MASTKAAELPSMIGTSLAVDLDVAVIDAEAAQRGQKMLDGADRDAGVVAEHGAQREILDVIDVGRNFSDDAAAFADQKTVAGVGIRRVQNHRNRCSAVDPRAGQLDLAPNRRLSRADKSIRHCAPSLDPLSAQDAVPSPVSPAPRITPLRSPACCLAYPCRPAA